MQCRNKSWLQILFTLFLKIVEQLFSGRTRPRLYFPSRKLYTLLLRASTPFSSFPPIFKCILEFFQLRIIYPVQPNNIDKLLTNPPHFILEGSAEGRRPLALNNCYGTQLLLHPAIPAIFFPAPPSPLLLDLSFQIHQMPRNFRAQRDERKRDTQFRKYLETFTFRFCCYNIDPFVGDQPLSF